MLISVKNKTLYCIDHTNAFKNAAIWDRFCLKQGIESNDYKDTRILKDNYDTYGEFFLNKIISKKDLYETADNFINKLNCQTINDIFCSIPTTWSILPEDLKALNEYIIYRLNYFKEICDLIISYQEDV